MRSPARPRRAGFTLVEVLVVITVLVVALGMLAHTSVSISRLGPVRRESALAMSAARTAIERVRAASFADAFAMFDSNADNDPPGPVPSPGAAFDVLGLTPRPGDADGLSGEIRFPTLLGALREDAVDPDLGLPRDLNGDGEIDAEDHSADYVMLPVNVQIEWRGQTGNRRYDLYTTLAAP